MPNVAVFEIERKVGVRQGAKQANKQSRLLNPIDRLCRTQGVATKRQKGPRIHQDTRAWNVAYELVGSNGTAAGRHRYHHCRYGTKLLALLNRRLLIGFLHVALQIGIYASDYSRALFRWLPVGKKPAGWGQRGIVTAATQSLKVGRLHITGCTCMSGYGCGMA